MFVRLVTLAAVWMFGEWSSRTSALRFRPTGQHNEQESNFVVRWNRMNYPPPVPCPA